MTYKQKIFFLENYLTASPKNYRDSFKTDIVLYLNDDFNSDNPYLTFLTNLNTKDDIKVFVNDLCSSIVMKFDEKDEQINDHIYSWLVSNSHD